MRAQDKRGRSAAFRLRLKLSQPDGEGHQRIVRTLGLGLEPLAIGPYRPRRLDELVDEIRSRRERLGISYLVVFEKDMEISGR